MRIHLILNALFLCGKAAYSITPNLRSKIDDVNDNYTEEAEGDRIYNLPGLPKDSKVNQFSGYLTVDRDTNRNIFYWFVESLSDPSTDPVVLWTNGGPGCSGLLGFGTEQGPFHIEKDGVLTTNPFAWNNIANMIFVEQPAGVGFSYTDEKNAHTNDKKAAVDNYELIKQFFLRFPQLQSNKFYLASESYGGHYMPQLAEQILKKNTDNSINFKGFLVGNPYVDSYSNSVAQYSQMYYDGLIAKPLYDKYEKKCTKGADGFLLSLCPEIEALMLTEMGTGINPYALSYPVCIDSDSNQEKRLGSQGLKLLYHTMDQFIFQKTFLSDVYETSYEPCSEQYLNSYLNRQDVREAIHAKPEIGDWRTCSFSIHYEFNDRFNSQVGLYKKLVNGENDLNILVYSGDNDSVCPTSGTEEWIFDLGVEPKPGHYWKEWHGTDSQVAGYETEFDVTDGKLFFATVHGAGHEVPAYKPMQSYLLFERFINNT